MRPSPWWKPARLSGGGAEPSAALLLAAALCAGPAAGQHPAEPAPAALEPAATGGLAAVDRALAKLGAHRRLLVVGAHPDDEDNAVLALVGRGLGGEAAYLSLSRGEGGQNLIGPELGVALGVLRTGELLAARRVEGTRQLFARAFDFGYTRSLEETLERWPREVILEDAVRAVRRFKPQVLVAVFPADERAGHGQHQMSAVIAGELLAVAGPPDRYPGLTAEGLPPWQPQALYLRTWWREAEESDVEERIDALEPLDGRSVAQVAAASRSLHRSQDMGRLQPLGPRKIGFTRLAGVEGAPEALSSSQNPAGEGPSAGASGRGASQEVGTESGLFAGIDTRLAAIADSLDGAADGTSKGSGEKDQVERELERVAALAGEARSVLSPAALERAVPALAEIARRLAAARDMAAAAGGGGSVIVTDLLDEKLAVARAGLAAAAGLALDAWAGRERAVPGEALEVAVELWIAGSQPVTLRRVRLLANDGWSAEPQEIFPGSPGFSPPSPTVPVAEALDGVETSSSRLAAGSLSAWTFRVEIPANSLPTLPYFVRRPREGDLYDWSAVAAPVLGEPYQPPPLVARVAVEVDGVPLVMEREVVHRAAEQALGEVRRPLRAVPALEVGLEPRLLVWPAASREPRRLRLDLVSNLRSSVSGRLRVVPPAGWPEPPPIPFELAPGERRPVAARLDPPAELAPGGYRYEAVAVTEDGARYAAALPVVEYPHVRPAALSVEAAGELRVVDLELPALGRVGYLRGASDGLPEALAAVGVPVELLAAGELTVERLAACDAVVVGSRAYESDPALARANGRLLEYVRGGGTLIVQYQQYPFVEGGYAPYRLEIARPHGRVTDEGSPVRPLVPEHAVFRRPNAIGPQDWEGWVQERGLYFAADWDGEYTPLLALRDPGREEERGALLVARYGAGTYVYTGLAFFRQLPAGVPGAYRLFANLLALGLKEEPG